MERTPTETLMDALSECETAEDVLIIIVHDDGTIGSYSSTSRLHEKLGMIEAWKALWKDSLIHIRDTEA